METVYEYNELVLYGAEVLRLMPTFMKKLVFSRADGGSFRTYATPRP